MFPLLESGQAYNCISQWKRAERMLCTCGARQLPPCYLEYCRGLRHNVRYFTNLKLPCYEEPQVTWKSHKYILLWTALVIPVFQSSQPRCQTCDRRDTPVVESLRKAGRSQRGLQACMWGSELWWSGHHQRSGLLLMCCLSEGQQWLPPPHPGSSQDQVAFVFQVESFPWSRPPQIQCCAVTWICSGFFYCDFI